MGEILQGEFDHTGVLDVTKRINNYTNLGDAQNEELHRNTAKSEPTWILFLCGGGLHYIH